MKFDFLDVLALECNVTNCDRTPLLLDTLFPSFTNFTNFTNDVEVLTRSRIEVAHFRYFVSERWGSLPPTPILI